MEDHILRATAADGKIRIFVATTKNTVNDALKIHKTLPNIIEIFSKMLTVSSIMGCMLKNDKDIITLNIKGEGLLKNMTVTSDSKSQVRGYFIEQKQKTNEILLNSNLTIIKDIGLKEAVSSKIKVISEEISQTIKYYFEKSEQIQSSIYLNILQNDSIIKQSNGCIIQAMPNISEDIRSFLKENIKKDIFEKTDNPYDIIKKMFEKYNIKIYEKIPVKYYCNCSRQKVEKALAVIGIDELKNILKEEKKANIHCHFCNKDYNFDEKDLINLIKKLK